MGSAGIYAKSLYDLGVEEGLCDQLLTEMETVRDIFASEPDFVMLLATPSLSKEERAGMLDVCLRGKVQPYLLNFIKILTERNLIRSYSDCCAVFRDLYNEDHGILPVDVVSAVPLDEEQRAKLGEKLCRMTGMKVELNCTVDPACLGGIRVDYKNQRIDGTVANRLSSVSELLKSTVF